MIDHKLCAPPRGKVVVALREDGGFVRSALHRPALAFVTEDPKDATRAVIWLPDCACMMNRRCPRMRMMVWTSKRYDVTSFKHQRPIVPPRRTAVRRRVGRSRA